LSKIWLTLGSCACRILSPLRNTHDAPWDHYVTTDNRTSSSKPEVHNASQRRQSRTEPRP